ncbi:MAG: 4Fe-4S ferredoxin [Chloroflexi bacterium]|nr:MAG: 4Fe-4S ferredoxin [Chloroflexota bacterium]
MTPRKVRKIIKIDEEKCDGCGLCVPACAEGAIQIVGGKARLVSEKYCDGLGACIGECPRGALTVEERESEEFDEEAVSERLQAARPVPEGLPCDCASTTVTHFGPAGAGHHQAGAESLPQSQLGHWPVQLRLVPPTAPFLQNADALLTGDCVPFAYAGFHQHLLKDHALLVACPKLDDFQAHQRKLTEVLRQSSVKSITVVRMEIPCCHGLAHMAQQAVADSGKDIPLREVVIGIRGEVKSSGVLERVNS